MALTAEWVRYGREAARRLRACIAGAKGDDPLAPVTVVVPSNQVGVATRRLLASGLVGPLCTRGNGLAAVTFVTPYRLAELLGAPALAGAGRRPVSTPVLAAAFRSALAEPGVFGPVAGHPATEQALTAAYRELRDVSDASLEALASTSARAGDVVRLCRAVRSALQPSWYDEEDLMAAATAAVTRSPRGTHALGDVVAYLPQRVSRHGAALLRALARERDLLVLSGASGDERADAAVVASVRRLGPAAAPPTGHSLACVSADRTTVVTCSDADDEVRTAVRAVVEAVRSGTPLDRVAVLHAGADPYGRLTHEHLHAAGLKTNGTSVVPLAARVAGRCLLGVLALAESDFSRGEVMAWLRGAPVRHAGHEVPAAAWERLSRAAGVVAGRRQWDERLGALAATCRAEAAVATADGDQPDWRAEAHERDAARAEGLREFVVGLADDIERAGATPRAWGDHARWATRLLARLIGDGSRRGGWPDDERKAAERVERALDRLGALDEVEGPVGLDVFARTLRLELDSDLGRLGRFGEGVLVGPIGLGTGLDLDLVVVLGLAEGTFPGPVRDDSLVPDHERRVAGGELALRAARVDDEHRQLLAALASSRRHLLCVPRGDLRRSRARVPSRWVLDIAGELRGARVWSDDLGRLDAPWAVHIGSFDAGVRGASSPATAQEHRLRSLMAADPATPGFWAAADPLTAAAADVVVQRRSAAFTRFDGNLAGLAVPSVVARPADAPARPASPTRLERWARCPFAYFMADVLRVEAVENPEDQLRMSPLDVGSLVHEVLERFLVEALGRAVPPGPGEPWDDADHARLDRHLDEAFARYEQRGLTGRALFWRRDQARLRADAHRFLDEDSRSRAARRSLPVAAELGFGTGDATLPAVTVMLPDGRRVLFRGKADRVDRSLDGGLHVVDYKTGKSNSYRGVDSEDPFVAGTKLQLPVYGLAARSLVGDDRAPVVAEYWFVSAKGGFTRLGYEVTDECLAAFGTVVATIATGIEGGVFVARPGPPSTSPFVECTYCEPDSLGTTDLRRAWERKRADPALAGYAALAEPTDLAPDVEGDDA